MKSICKSLFHQSFTFFFNSHPGFLWLWLGSDRNQTNGHLVRIGLWDLWCRLGRRRRGRNSNKLRNSRRILGFPRVLVSLLVHNAYRFANFLRIRVDYWEATLAIKFLAALHENTRVLDMLTLLGWDCHVCLHRRRNFTLIFSILGFKGFLFLQVRLILRLPPVASLSWWAHICSWSGFLRCLFLFFILFSILINVNLSFRADACSLKLLLLLLLNCWIWLPEGIRLLRDIILFDRFLYTAGRWSSWDITLAWFVRIFVLLGLRRLFLLLLFLLLFFNFLRLSW